MKNISQNILETIGNTPLVAVDRLAAVKGAGARVLVKVESRNPGGSVKDRVALNMIRTFQKEGRLPAGTTLIEPTSGNTGIGLAMASAALGLRLIIVMPDTMSIERRKLIAFYGAELVLTPGAQGMNGAIAKAKELQRQIPGSIIPQQFENPANPAAHLQTTGEEIWRDTDGEVDIFVAGVGTGGTVSGVGRALKAKKPGVQVVAVEPSDSPVLSGGKPGPHKIQGIGAGFIPGNYDRSAVDRVVQVSGDSAMQAARDLARSEGILAGISSGAALYAALELAAEPQNAGKTIVALLPDTGERYLSTPLFDIEGVDQDD
ncbi:cysteine synthase A [Neobittarella massiliensis]|uniref:cysteine synthase A n=1 Tax=Neobittarella massiliensis (ex Bilen et al. 2018) TaxID=2041842 RepID=UPI000CF6EAF2|nr:cysteine synthase A [Neobittarella massiliensis]